MRDRAAVARLDHSQKVASSNLAPATTRAWKKMVTSTSAVSTRLTVLARETVTIRRDVDLTAASLALGGGIPTSGGLVCGSHHRSLAQSG
jgi:hypothetical protein